MAMRFHVVTIFPELFAPFLETGVARRARQAGIVDVLLHNPRDFAPDHHRTVDDAPYGGGPGMVMRPEPFFETVDALHLPPGSPVVLLTPQGQTFAQGDAQRLARAEVVTLLCGRYEGVDERIRCHLATEEMSIGDYVVSGGELPAMVVVEAVVRLLPGAIGHGPEASEDDTHHSGLIQYPQYTRPRRYRGHGVPEVLVSGDHAAITRWRREQALRRTLQRRPDLLRTAPLGPADRQLLQALEREGEAGAPG